MIILLMITKPIITKPLSIIGYWNNLATAALSSPHLFFFFQQPVTNYTLLEV